MPFAFAVWTSKSMPNSVKIGPKQARGYPQEGPKGPKSAPRGDSRRFVAVSGDLLGRSWVPFTRFGMLGALLGVPPRLFGTYF